MKLTRQPYRIWQSAAILVTTLSLALASAALAQAPGLRIQFQQTPETHGRPPGASSSQGRGTSRALVIPGSQAPEGHSSDSVLELQRVWTPTAAQPLPPPPPAIAQYVVPDPFLGCWEGNPGGWDETHVFRPFAAVIGAPGAIVFCYKHHEIDVPEADVYISPFRRALDIVMSFGLSYDTFKAHSIHTDVYGVSKTKLHGTTTLTVENKLHLLMLIPVDAPDEPSLVEWSAELVSPNEIVMDARESIYLLGSPYAAGAWHGDFHRVAESPPTGH